MKKLERESRIDHNENINLNRYIARDLEPEHIHDFIEIEYIWCGSGYQVINGDTCHVERGVLLFFNFGDSHLIKASPGIEITNCLMNPEFVSEELVNSENAMDILNLSLFKDFGRGARENMTPRIKFTGKDLMELEAILEFMHKEFEGKKTGYKIVLKAYINILMTKIFRAVRQSDPVFLYNEVGKIAPQVLKYIEENYNKKFTLNELARIGCYNPSYFSRIFKECYGKSITEYINSRRMAAGIKLLEETSYTIENIAYQVGIHDKKRFYTLFKSYSGTTPDQYRKQIKKMTIHQ